jgi:Spy/CpxP family protein refolding chaperone
MEGRRGDFGGPGRHGRRGGRGFGRGFARDLNLTDAQRTQIRAIHDKYRPRIKAIHEQFKTQAEAARALRQKGDTAGARAAYQRLRTDVQAKIQPIRQQEQAEVRNVLTAEQRAKFDAAQTRMKERMQNRKRDGQRGKFGRYRPARS